LDDFDAYVHLGFLGFVVDRFAAQVFEFAYEDVAFFGCVADELSYAAASPVYLDCGQSTIGIETDNGTFNAGNLHHPRAPPPLSR